MSDDLGPLLGFTNEELALNRAGALSWHQLWEAIRTALVFGGLMLGVVGGLLAVVFVMRPTGYLRLVYVMLVPGALALLWLSASFVAAPFLRRVSTAEGPLDFRGSGRGPRALVIGGAWVEAPPRAATVLQKDESYRVYYLAGANQFLSIEPSVGAPGRRPAQ